MATLPNNQSIPAFPLDVMATAQVMTSWEAPQATTQHDQEHPESPRQTPARLVPAPPHVYEHAQYDFLNPKFLEAMNEIGQYGEDKYGENSYQQRAKRGDKSRGTLGRRAPKVIAQHAKAHFDMYLDLELHDHFHTRRHQLAAVAFNAMMEFYFAGLEEEQ